jgi:hypothetical protein
MTMALKIRLACAPLLVALLPLAAAAEPPEATRYLAQLSGGWDLTGTVRGKPAHYRAEGRWVLNGGWLRFSMTDVATPPQYEAQLVLGYDAKAGDYVAHWLDRFGAAGARVVASGERTGRTLVLLFPYPEGAFRDTLTLAADSASGTLLLEAQGTDGTWSTFASYRMRRVAPEHPDGAPR